MWFQTNEFIDLRFVRESGNAAELQTTGAGKECPGLLGEARAKGVKAKRFLLIFLAVLSFYFYARAETGCQAAPSPPALLAQADQCRRSLYDSPKQRKYRNNWLKCIRLYEDLFTDYPKSDEAGWALYQAAGMFKGLYRFSGSSKDLDEALRLYRRLADEYENHRLADDAQFNIGEIFYAQKKDPTQAYIEFLKVDIKFPSGDMRPRARKILDRLAATLSKKDEESSLKNANGSESGLVSVKDIRHWSTPNYTRVVVDLDSPVKYTHHLLKPDPDIKQPRRLYLDLQDAKVTSEIESAIPIKDGLLHRARAGQYKKDVVRVVLDIESLGGYKVFHLHDPFRIVVDVRRQEEKAEECKPELAIKKRPVRRGVRKSETPDDKVSLARQLGLCVKTIVIDPGHGGKDPGCYARRGVKEKDIVLRVAKLLAKKIKEKLDCEVILTREKDQYVPLESRTAFANMKKADLFISLHINAHRDNGISGLETYFLNMATDERAMMVAARENATSEKNISDLQTILNDLMLNTKIHESSRLAHEIQNKLVSNVKKGFTGIRDLGVKQAPFYVLIGAEMPAVLVETGFLTNPQEGKRLVLGKYQEKVAEGICAGITSYIKSIDRVYQGG